jgi:hypothetical protein
MPTTKMEATYSFEKLEYARATLPYKEQYHILHSHRCENVKPNNSAFYLPSTNSGQ